MPKDMNKMRCRLTSIQQHGRVPSGCGGDAVAEKRIDFVYDADGQYATVTRYADLAGTELVATATYSFDDAYQLVGLSYTKGTTTLASYNYTFDAAGNMTSMTTVDGTVNYTSDATGQLTAAGTDSYAYDSNGNRTTANGSTYVTGTDNELVDDGTYTYTYDAEGNRLTKTDKATGAETDYTWDYRDRLGSVTFKDANGNVTETVYYQYDAFNHLVGETVSVPGQAAQQTVWVYDRSQIVSQFDGTGTSLTANNLSHRYLWNPQAVDQLFADEQLSPLPPGEGGGEGYDLTTPGNVLWALTDHENSVRDLATYDPGTDVTTIANHRVYDAYGNLTSQTNAAVDCLFGYTGRQFDQATGLQNNLNRWYDPTLGRWLSEDPLSFAGGDTNLYRYVRGVPTGFVDPLGLWEWPWSPNASWNPYDTLSLWTGVDKNQFPHGAGYIPFSESIELGNIVAGAGETFSTGVGLFTGGGLGAFGTFGGFIGDVFGPSYPCDSRGHGAAGAFAGYGQGVFLTNASNVQQLQGRFDSFNLNVGAFPFGPPVQPTFRTSGNGFLRISVPADGVPPRSFNERLASSARWPILLGMRQGCVSQAGTSFALNAAWASVH